MADAVANAFECGEHLLVQAGTGTGKSLGYLVPSLLNDGRVVVATATLALQHQLVERDLPALLDAAESILGSRPSYAVLKGRSNYACLHRLRDGVPDDQGTLIEVPTGPEVILGSTRLKAGTAQKLVLNSLSTAALVALGRTWSNLMVGAVVTNEKLRGRLVHALATATGSDVATCAAALDGAGGDGRAALLCLLTGAPSDRARAALDEAGGAVRPALASLTARADGDPSR